MEIQRDIGAEAIEKLEELFKDIKNLKENLKEKDKKILDLEYKLKNLNNG